MNASFAHLSVRTSAFVKMHWQFDEILTSYWDRLFLFYVTNEFWTFERKKKVILNVQNVNNAFNRLRINA